MNSRSVTLRMIISAFCMIIAAGITGCRESASQSDRLPGNSSESSARTETIKPPDPRASADAATQDALISPLPARAQSDLDSAQPAAQSQPAQVSRGELDLSPVLNMPGRQTEHFFIYSQLSKEMTDDLALRLEVLFEYNTDRFASVLNPSGFPRLVFLFNNREDFVAAGGHPTMPGQFHGGGDGFGARLMMIFSGGDLGSFMASCPLMYHEGFHQFRELEIGEAGNPNRAWPRWLGEGFANAFNNVTWTGDGWVDGMARQEMVHSAISNAASFITIDDLIDNDGAWLQMTADGKLWSLYMQSWSLVHFLDNAQGQKYRPLLNQLLSEVTDGVRSPETFGAIAAVEGEYLNWLRSDFHIHMTGAKYFEVFAAMVTSHVARAHARGQRFESGDEFLALAQQDKLNMPPAGSDQWLPDSLRQEMLWYRDLLANSYGEFELSIEYPDGGGAPTVNVNSEWLGLALEGDFELSDDGQVQGVDVIYMKCISLDLAKAMGAGGSH